MYVCGEKSVGYLTKFVLRKAVQFPDLHPSSQFRWISELGVPGTQKPSVFTNQIAILTAFTTITTLTFTLILPPLIFTERSWTLLVCARLFKVGLNEKIHQLTLMSHSPVASHSRWEAFYETLPNIFSAISHTPLSLMLCWLTCKVLRTTHAKLTVSHISPLILQSKLELQRNNKRSSPAPRKLPHLNRDSLLFQS